MFAQVIGAIIGAAVLYAIASGKAGFSLDGGFASNGYGEHSPGKYSLQAALIAEVVLTAVFLFVIMGATHGKAPAGFAPLAIGLALTMIHLISIPVTNTSVNPARSTGPALFVGGWALRATVVVLGRAAGRRHHRRRRLSLDQRRRTARGNGTIGAHERQMRKETAGFGPPFFIVRDWHVLGALT
jgi:hypothetical protein